MTQQNKSASPKNSSIRQHRVATYLSNDEYKALQKAFDDSEFTTLSQFHRYLISNGIEQNNDYLIHLSSLNYEITNDFSDCVNTLNRLVTELEILALEYEDNNETDKLDKLKSIIEYVNKVDKAMYSLVHFMQLSTEHKEAIKTVAHITLNCDDLIEIATSFAVDKGIQ